MRAIVAATVGLTVFAAGAALTAPKCAPVSGSDGLWAKPQTRMAIFGEIHGTTEIPAFVGDVVCLAARDGRRVVLGVEMRPQDADAPIARYLASKGTAADRAQLIADWLPAVPDARSSEAMADLIVRVRALQRAGARISVLSFDPVGPAAGAPEAREQAMADTLRQAAEAQPGVRLLILTGGAHARHGVLGPNGTIASMTTRLPAGVAVTVGVAPQGGTIWNCRLDMTVPAMVCPPKTVEAPAASMPRGIVFGAGGEGYDAAFSADRLSLSPLHGRFVRTEAAK